MSPILEYLEDLSAPRLTQLSTQLCDEYEDEISLGSPEWHIPIFGDVASLCQVAISPLQQLLLELDVTNLSVDLMSLKFFTFIPNVRALVLRGSILWMRGSVDVHLLT